ncbi:PTS sugar transporter subunit IIA [Cellulomonas fengjieae]|uniref:PTS glucose transporter subunit IIA n=1 Tax=Cellulomonas fengjieae TaxID=2819978 RepID=A0ABS3SHQ7_9CELL|nr:PTS glucose transporter subunit IIA [Cellulomonas fengjieae]MBO3085187.1 PTS glucose transporter subunit IIA [Cellulomonas fengjieae]MBO3100928.1 PTS glucose transporter subunit IIA [Cellulomonas fengjieae]QVI66241.1 PTS glucose transporter subunit IIA [Cellulomonas fengjieae]
MTALTVLAPVSGQVLALSEVPDPVFSAELVGPGLAIDPPPQAGAEVVSPIGGTIVKLHPHAFVVQHEDGRAVLVHLGIDTVELGGAGFTLHTSEGSVVRAGQVVLSWDAAAVAAGGRSPVCPVVGLEAPAGALDRLAAPGDTVAAGAPLLSWA